MVWGKKGSPPQIFVYWMWHSQRGAQDSVSKIKDNNTLFPISSRAPTEGSDSDVGREEENEDKENSWKMVTRSSKRASRKKSLVMDAGGNNVRGRKMDVSKAKKKALEEVVKGTQETLSNFVKNGGKHLLASKKL